jgi:hypothetical protein
MEIGYSFEYGSSKFFFSKNLDERSSLGEILTWEGRGGRTPNVIKI